MTTNKKEEISLHGRAIEILQKTLKDSYAEVRAASEIEANIASEADSLTYFLQSSDSRAFCILAVSFLEDALRRTLIEYWALSSRESQDNYFGSNGPLSTFSQRILVAVGLGWISNHQAKSATRLRKIRNEFAHNHLVHNLTDQKLYKSAEGLHPYDKAWQEIPEYNDAYLLLDLEKILRMRVYCNVFQIVGGVLARAKLMSSGIPPSFWPGIGFDNLTEIEQHFGDHMIQFCFSVTGIPFRKKVTVDQ
ncbi:hypothetical protein KXR77_20980 [Xanthomonas euvesicatoria]